jgi:hypothetical protein
MSEMGLGSDPGRRPTACVGAVRGATQRTVMGEESLSTAARTLTQVDEADGHGRPVGA